MRIIRKNICIYYPTINSIEKDQKKNKNKTLHRKKKGGISIKDGNWALKWQCQKYIKLKICFSLFFSFKLLNSQCQKYKKNMAGSLRSKCNTWWKTHFSKKIQHFELMVYLRLCACVDTFFHLTINDGRYGTLKSLLSLLYRCRYVQHIPCRCQLLHNQKSIRRAGWC